VITRKSYSFYCKELNKEKYNLLYSKAVELKDFRNKISNEVCTNITRFIEMSKFDWINHFRTKLEHCNNQDISNSIEEVYTSYDNKFNNFKQSIQFKVQDKLEYTYYKRNTKSNKNGDVKSFDVKLKSTKLTKIMSYLARYYNDSMLEWLEIHKDDDLTKKQLRNDAYNILLKYKSKIIPIIESKRNRIIRKLTEHPIQFNSLTYKSCNEIRGDLLNRNNNLQSIFGCIITLGAQNTQNGKLHIPVKYNDQHHGMIEDYSKLPNKKGQKVISYRVCFEPKNKIRIILSKESEYNEIIDKHEYLGVDVNVKHNLFYTSLDDSIDYDRSIFNDYVKFLKKLDTKHKNKLKYNQNTTLSKKDSTSKIKWITRIKDMLKRKSNQLVNYTLQNNKNHLVLENLELMAKSFTRNDEFDGFKYSRLIRLLNLADLKNIIYSIANKHNVQVTFVQPHFTSQTCKCGNISRDNRKTQEMFSCVDCGRTLNADFNSSLNIESRMSREDLRSKLLSNKDGIFTPKKLGKNTIKNIIYDSYTNSDKTVVK
jgi:putative transposase